MDKDFATSPMTWYDLLSHVQGQQVRLTRRFGIILSSGKQQIFDDAAAGGQSDSSVDGVHLQDVRHLMNARQVCAALQDVRHLVRFSSTLKQLSVSWPMRESIGSAGEDLSDALTRWYLEL